MACWGSRTAAVAVWEGPRSSEVGDHEASAMSRAAGGSRAGAEGGMERGKMAPLLAPVMKTVEEDILGGQSCCTWKVAANSGLFSKGR